MCPLSKSEEYARLYIFIASANRDDTGNVLDSVDVHPEGSQASIEGKICTVHIWSGQIPKWGGNSTEIVWGLCV